MQKNKNKNRPCHLGPMWLSTSWVMGGESGQVLHSRSFSIFLSTGNRSLIMHHGILFLYQGETVLCPVPLVFAVGVMVSCSAVGYQCFHESLMLEMLEEPWIAGWHWQQELDSIFMGSNVKAWFISSISSFTSTPWKCEQEAQQETLEPYYEPDRSTTGPCT